MSKNKTAIINNPFFRTFMVFILILGLSACVYYFYTHNLIKFPNLVNKTSEKNKEPLLKDQVGNFIILPTDYLINDTEIALFSSRNIKTVFLMDGNEEKLVTLSTDLNKKLSYIPQYYVLTTTSEYKKCNISKLSDVDNSKSNISEYNIVKGDCNNLNILTKVVDFECDGKMNSCQSDLFKYLNNSKNSESYFYMQSSPFTQPFSDFKIFVKQKTGVVIITWGDELLPYNLTQSAYSLEYLDKNNKRIGAGGLIEKSNRGDFYLPAINYEGKDITVKLRVWYNFKNERLSQPLIYRESFNYAKVTNQDLLNNLTPRTPVEMAWIPEWGMQEGLASVRKNPKKWNTISPTWFFPKKDGTLSYQYKASNADLILVLKQNSIKLVPTFVLFDEDILDDILHNHMQKHIDEIVNVAVQNSYDGIDLDYESTYSKDKELLTEFVTKLALKLHEKGKTLSFTAMPKIDDADIYSFASQTHKAQDWKAIGSVVDEFRIMAYDFTSQSNKEAGPLSPLQWDEAIITYAIENMPANKVVLALPIYSHAWPKAGINTVGINNDRSLNSGLYNNALSWQPDEISYIEKHSEYYNEFVNNWYGETFASLKYKGKSYEMYYLSKTDINKRLELAKKYGIKGLAYWRIGGDQL